MDIIYFLQFLEKEGIVMKKLLLVCAASFAMACVSRAQQANELVKDESGDRPRWYVSPGIGIMILDGPTDNKPVFFDFSIGYDLTDYFSVEAGMMYAPAHDAAPGVKGGQSAGPHVDALFHLLGKDGGRWDPYLTAGLAYWFSNGPLFYERYREVLVPRIGVGLAYHMTDNLSLRLEGKTGFPFRTRDIDDGWITTVELGLLYRFGGGSGSGNDSGKSDAPKSYNNTLAQIAPKTEGLPAVQDTTPADADDWMRFELLINFDYNLTIIKPEYNEGLNLISRTIKKATANNPGVTVSVEGHADQRQGSDAAYNQDLSERRAEVVKAYLVGTGVDSAKIKTAGYGFNRPKDRAKVDLINGNPENRRVEIIIHGVGDAASRNKLRQD